MRVLKKILPWLVVIISLGLLVYIPEVGPERYSDLASLFSTERARQASSGYVVAAIRNGAVIYAEAFGTDGNGKALGIDSPMYLGPSSEVLTGALLFSLTMDGKIRLDDDVRNYLPWFGEGSVQIRDLAAHAMPVSGNAPGFDLSLPGLEAGDLDLESFIKSRLTAAPVTRSRLSYRALGLAMESAAGQPFDEMLQSRILIPLGMHSTTSRPDSLQGVTTGSGSFFGFRFPYGSAIPLVAAPADGIVSTAADMAKLAAYLTAPPKGLSPRTFPARGVAALYQPLLPAGETGYGWRIIENDGNRLIFQGGTVEGFSSRIVLWPERRAGIVLLSPHGGVIQSSLVLPMLASAAESIMFEGSSRLPFPTGRATILAAIISVVYLAGLFFQTSAAFSWARKVIGRDESLSSPAYLLYSITRTSLGLLFRLALVVLLPVAVGVLMGRTVSLRELLVLEPGMTAVFISAILLGTLRNTARLVWLFTGDLGYRFAARRTKRPA